MEKLFIEKVNKKERKFFVKIQSKRRNKRDIFSDKQISTIIENTKYKIITFLDIEIRDNFLKCTSKEITLIKRKYSIFKDGQAIIKNEVIEKYGYNVNGEIPKKLLKYV